MNYPLQINWLNNTLMGVQNKMTTKGYSKIFINLLIHYDSCLEHSGQYHEK